MHFIDVFYQQVQLQAFNVRSLKATPRLKLHLFTLFVVNMMLVFLKYFTSSKPETGYLPVCWGENI